MYFGKSFEYKNYGMNLLGVTGYKDKGPTRHCITVNQWGKYLLEQTCNVVPDKGWSKTVIIPALVPYYKYNSWRINYIPGLHKNSHVIHFSYFFGG